jgi:hypothetical protein
LPDQDNPFLAVIRIRKGLRKRVREHGLGLPEVHVMLLDIGGFFLVVPIEVYSLL